MESSFLYSVIRTIDLKTGKSPLASHIGRRQFIDNNTHDRFKSKEENRINSKALSCILMMKHNFLTRRQVYAII